MMSIRPSHCLIAGLVAHLCLPLWGAETHDATVRATGSFRMARRQVLNLAIRPVAEDPNATSSAGSELLRELTRRLETLDLPRGTAPQPKPTATHAPIAATAPAPVAAPAVSSTPASDAGRGTAETVETILQQAPERVIDPLKAAEALYAIRDLRNAARCFILALGRTRTDMNDKDRPWALLQAANSLRRDKPAEAAKYYQQLLSEYPGHDFARAAKAQKDLLEQRGQSDLRKVLERYVGDPNSL